MTTMTKAQASSFPLVSSSSAGLACSAGEALEMCRTIMVFPPSMAHCAVGQHVVRSSREQAVHRLQSAPFTTVVRNFVNRNDYPGRYRHQSETEKEYASRPLVLQRGCYRKPQKSRDQHCPSSQWTLRFPCGPKGFYRKERENRGGYDPVV